MCRLSTKAYLRNKEHVDVRDLLEDLNFHE
jgi:hypothetical protein